jgi:transcriptional regulator with XRE-family HTH domain
MQTLAALKERTQWAINYVAEQKNLKPTQIGRIIGSKPDTIRKYRTRLATPSVRFLQRFCTAFEIDFLWLSKGIGKPFPGDDVEFTKTPDVPENESDKSDVPAGEDISTRPSDEESDEVVWADSEISFQKLALMAGIKIDGEWILKLSEVIGVEPWKISLSIHHHRIGRKLIDAVESYGFKKEAWLVAIQAQKDMPATGNHNMDTSRLLKIAEKVLRSNTIHSTSLAMNIISLKAISETQPSASLMGARAITLPKTHDLQIRK